MQSAPRAQEASPLLGGSGSYDPIQARRIAVFRTIVLVLSTSIAKNFVDYALYSTESAISADTDSPLVVSTLPGVGTAAYAVGKVVAILTLHLLGGKWPLVAASALGIVTSLLFCVGAEWVYFVAWLPWKFVTVPKNAGAPTLH